MSGGHFLIRDSRIMANGSHGIYFEGSENDCEVEISNDSVVNNGNWGIYFSISGMTTSLTGKIKGSVISGNSGTGLYMSAGNSENENTISIDSNVISGNGYTGISCSQYAFPTITGNTITGHIKNPGIELNFYEEYWTESKYLITGNTITDNGDGILAREWSRVIAQYNNIYDNTSNTFYNWTPTEQDCRYTRHP